MGPKKKDATASTKLKKKGSSDAGASARPAKGGAAKVTISAENEQRLRRLLLHNNVAVSRSTPTTDDDNHQKQEALSDSQKKQASRRLRGIYDNLASEGFTNSQIELALSTVSLEKATLEMVLDWLCFNIPGHELPKKYSSSGVALEEIEGSSVHLLTAAKKDWAPQLLATTEPIKQEGVQEVVHLVPLVKEKNSEKEMKMQAEWIRKYMEEGPSESSSSGSDVDSDWEVLADNKAKQHRKHIRAVTDPGQRALSIASEFRAAKTAAIAAKQKGDKEKQFILGRTICKLKEEMSSLGLSEEILLEESGASEKNATHLLSDSNYAVNNICSANEIIGQSCNSQLYDVHGTKNQEETIDSASTEKDTLEIENQTCVHGTESEGDINVSASIDTAILEPEEDVCWMFNEGETDINLPASILELQRKESATSWARKRDISGKKHVSQKEKKQETQASSMQRLPKALLQQQCQKSGWDVPKYEKVSGKFDFYAYNVSITRPSSGRGKGKKVGGVTTYSVPQNTSGFNSVEEAQNAAALWALFCLFPDLPLYNIIPEPYWAMILQWHVEGGSEDVKEALEPERREAFIDSLMITVKKPEPAQSTNLSTSTQSYSSTEDSVKPFVEIVGHPGKKRGLHEGDESRTLLLKYQERMKRKSWKEMLRSRNALPIFAVKTQVVNQIRNNEVVVISGETGSGKTTQVPQYILEDLINNNQGAVCKIICTQPRRLAAISIAQRVAAEQGDGAPGDGGSLVGYQVRLDSARTNETKLLFCTTGILLRQLSGDRDLAGVSHVIVDEVHERSILGDFTLTILKDLIERRRALGHVPLKVILMSATVDATMFSKYFWNCPVVNVEGRTFPVDTMYLEDVYEMLHYQLPLDSPAALASDPVYIKKKFSQNLVGSRRERINIVPSGWGEDVFEDKAVNPLYEESLYKGYSQRTKDNLLILNEDAIDLDAVEDLVIHIDRTDEDGAILVFLPGIGDIFSLVDRLSGSEHFSGVAADWILPLHSSVSVIEQQKAFEIPPAGIRKVVVATNIAETSITIEDVVYVIDCGKHKEIQYDPRRGMSRMVETWISQANAKQRRGRAGRVKCGYCFCLYTRFRFENLLRPFQLPEMLRVPLVELCLQIKFLSLGEIRNFLEKAIDSPKLEAIQSAISTLHEVGALDKQEELTSLGFHLAKLPVDVHIGKMMLYATIMGCLSPILTIAACLSYKSPFSASREQSGAVLRVKHALISGVKESNGLGFSICRGQQSDQLVMAAAYSNWKTVVKKRGIKSGYEYCKANCLSVSTLNMLKDMRNQFAVLLADIGFISIPEGNSANRYDFDQWIDDPKLLFNSHAYIPSVIKATLCAGLYPNVAKMDEESIRLGHANAMGRRAGLSSAEKVHWGDGRQEVFIHPSSINHNISEFQHPFLVFHEKVKTSKVYIRDTTLISPYMLLLFGGDISVQHQTGQVSVDGWLKMNAPAQIAVLFKELRITLDSVLKELMNNPKDSCIGSFGTVISSIVKLLLDEESTAA